MQAVLSKKGLATLGQAVQFSLSQQRVLAAESRRNERNMRAEARLRALEERKAKAEKQAKEKMLSTRIEQANVGFANIIALTKTPALRRYLDTTGAFGLYEYRREVLTKSEDRISWGVYVNLGQEEITIDIGTDFSGTTIHVELKQPRPVQDLEGRYWVYDIDRNGHGARADKSHADFVKSLATCTKLNARTLAGMSESKKPECDPEDLIFNLFVDCASQRKLSQYVNDELARIRESSKKKK